MRLTQTDLEDLFWQATVLALGLDPQSSSVQSFVRLSWPAADTGNGSWERDDDVIFLRVSPGTDSYSSLSEIRYEADKKGDLQEVYCYHRSFEVLWICYGPNSADNADKLRIGIQRPDVRAYLLKKEVAVIPDLRDPVRAPELDSAGQVWERSDLACRFYAVTTQEKPVGYFDTPPDITVTTN